MTLKRSLLVALLAMVMVLSLLAFGACKKQGDATNESTSESSSFVEGDEAGIYYVKIDGAEYLLTLSGSSYYLTLGNLAGNYSVDGNTLTLNNAAGNISATTADDSVTLTYDGGTYRFMRRVEYVVSFDSLGGEEMDDIHVLNGQTLDYVYDASKTGYIFVGWYTDEAYTKPFDYSSITSDVTLYAKYIEKTGAEEFSVWYHNNGDYDYGTTINGTVVDFPKVGEGFVGWYVSDSNDEDKLTYKYEGQVLTQDTDLYAVYGDVTLPSISSTGIAWDAAGVNVEYSLKITRPNGATESWRGTQTSFSYDFASKAAGEYTVALTVNGKTKTGYFNNKTLSTVCNFSRVDDYIMYNAVANAEQYIITVVDANGTHVVNNGQNLSFSIANYEATSEGLSVYVTAEANGYVSSTSDEIVYYKVLETPSGLHVNSSLEVLSWDATSDAMGYNVVVKYGNNTHFEKVGKKTSFSLKGFTGNLTLQVVAYANGYANAYSDELEYVKTTLAAPEGVAITNGQLTWDAVSGAVSYNVKVGNRDYSVDGCSFDLTALAAALNGSNELSVSVQAVAADGANSSLYTDAIAIKALAQKDEISYANGYVTWKYTVGADYYQVRINGITSRVTDENYFPVEFTKAGYNEIAVRHCYNESNYTDWAIINVYAYKVTFDVMGGRAIDPLYKAPGDLIYLPAAVLPGYDFSKWYLTPNGSGKYLTSGTFEGNSDVVLYAGYTPKAYMVNFDLTDNGVFANEPADEDKMVAYLQDFTLPVPDSLDSTKAFAGWFSEANGKGTQYTDGSGESLAPWSELAEEKTLVAAWVDMFRYTKVSGGTAYAVSGTTGVQTAKSVKVAPTYDGLPVTTIESNAFAGAKNLETIEIPDTVTNVEVGTAFMNCKVLEAINVYDAKAMYPDDEVVQGLEAGAYYSNEGVLYYNNQNTGKEIVFIPMAKTGAYTVLEGTESIPTNVFYNINLTSVVLPYTLKTINASAFQNANTLEDVIFEATPDGEDEIPLEISNQAFKYCGALVEVTLPTRVTEFTTTTFFSCSYLAKVNFEGEGGNYTSKDGIVFNAEGTTLLYVPKNHQGDEDEGVYTIPAGTNTIAEDAFRYNTRIGRVIIPGYVTMIETNAFYSCSSISQVVFEGTVDSPDLTIKESAFWGNSRLTSITLPANLKTLETMAFESCVNLHKVTVESVGDVDFAPGAFKSSNGVLELTIGKDLGLVEINGVFGSSIETISLSPENPNYAIQDDVLFNNDMTVLVYYPSNKTGDYEIPASVTTLGANVFAGKFLTTVTIGKNVESIGSGAFENCYDLTSVEFEGDRTAELTIGNRAFAGTSVADFVLPEMTTTLGDYVFAKSFIETLTIPSTITRMGTYNGANLAEMYMFDACSRLYHIEVAAANENFYSDNGILYLKKNGEVSELIMAPSSSRPTNDPYAATYSNDIVVPSTVTKVWAKAFYNNNQVKTIKFTSENAVTVGDLAFSWAKQLKEVELSEGFTTISQQMFQECRLLEKITIPAACTSIKAGAFYNDFALTDVVFVERTEGQTLVLEDAINQSASEEATGGGQMGVFAGCINLKSITLPEGTTKIGKSAFAVYAQYEGYGLVGLESVVIPSTVTEIGDNAFAGYGKAGIAFGAADTMLTEIGNGNSALTSVTFVAKENGTYSLTKMGTGAFGLTHITEITIPTSLTEIPDGAFKGTESLTTVYFPEGTQITRIGKGAFQSSAVSHTGTDEGFVIPNTVKQIDQNAFVHCHNLTSVEFTLVEGKAKLEDVKAGIGLNAASYSIGIYAFADTAVESFVFPETDNATGKYTVKAGVFNLCSELKTVTISNAVNDVTGVFTGCASIESILLDENNENLLAKMNPEDTNTLIYNRSGDNQATAIRLAYGNLGESFTIPTGITEIGERAFEGHNELKTVVIPAGVKTIKNYAFMGCEGLESVVFEENSMLTDMGMSVFANCTSLASISLPETITAIPVDTFFGCTGLKSYTIADTVTSIGGRAFSASGLTSITIPASVQKIGELYVSARDTALNLLIYYGQVFLDCVNLRNVDIKGTPVIGTQAFKNCVALENITIPQGVKTVGNNAFENSGLKSVTIYDGTVLGAYTGATGANAGKNVMEYSGGLTLAASVFKGCESLRRATFIGDNPVIPANTFQNCTSLITVEFVLSDGTVLTNETPEGLSMLGQYAFNNTGLTSFAITTAISKAGYNFMFSGCKYLREVYVPEALTQVYQSFCQDCSSLENYGYVKEDGTKVNNALSPNVNSLATNCFKGCSSLEYLPLPATQSINVGNYAFQNCTIYSANDGVFTFPQGTTSLGLYVLSGCENIHTVILNNRITAFGDTYYNTGAPNAGMTAFQSMSNLTELVIPQNLEYKVDNGFIFRGTTIVGYLGGVIKGEVEIPAYTKTIGARAFENNTHITKVYLNKGLQYIGMYAFNGCTNLGGEIDLTHVEAIGPYCFNGTAITSVTIGGNLSTIAYNAFTKQTIPNYAFADCPYLETVVIGDGINTMQMGVFSNCTSIREIIIPDTVKTMQNDIFAGWTAAQTIYYRASADVAPKSNVSVNKTCFAEKVYDYRG